MPELVVRVIGDTSALERSYRKAQKDTQTFGVQMKGAGRELTRTLGAAAAGFFSARGLVRGFESSIAAASDLNEQMSKNQQVFGRSAQEVQSWSQTTAAAFGISERQALATASSFGALFAPMGLVGTKAAEQSRKLTELGADLASFYNTDVQDALDAIRSGIVGESEPLRRYGVLLSESRVQAEALGETHKQSAKDLTAAEKALARITLIFKDTSKAQGDFGRTSEGLANQSRILRAELDDLESNIGQFYLPGLTKLAHAANEAIEELKGVEDVGPSERERAALIPKLAAQYEGLRRLGIGTAGAMSLLRESLGNTAKAGDLVGDALNYAAGGPIRGEIQKLREEIYGLGTDAETAAKSMHGLAAETTAVTMAAAAAAPRGLAALTPGQRATLDVAGARSPAARLEALREYHRVLMRQAEFARGRLGRAPAGPARGGSAATWAEKLRGILEEDSSVLAQIRGLQADNVQKAKEIKNTGKTAREVAEALREQFRRDKERRLGWLDFAIEKADATKGIADNRRALRAKEKFLQELIRSEGRSLERVRELWRTRQQIRDLNKSKADVDPLAGLMQVSSKRMAALLGAGLGLSPAGMGRLQANIAGQEIHNYVYMDGRQVAHSVNRANAQTGHRTSRQTSGFRG